MGPIRLLLATLVFGILTGVLTNHGAPGRSETSRVTSPATDITAGPGSTLQSGKLIALTFDDGPRPYVLFGSKRAHSVPGLADILDHSGIKATFFVVGWRLTPKTWGDRHEEDIGVTCLDAAKQMASRGHELEDHTFSHIELRTAESKRGEQWVMHDVARGAEAIEAVTGVQPRYLRPPDWTISKESLRELEQEGYRILTISAEKPMALRDVNSLDYLCAGRHPIGCPKPSLVDGVLKQVEQREKKGTYTHILAFHELSTTTAVMPQLINDLKARGYRFVTVSEYMNLVVSQSR
jgi:peptidoglycan/xylan/chitin deacetylase (PgdA/CDA1 family)